MPVKGIKKVQKNVNKLAEKIAGPITEKTMMSVLITGQKYAAVITPRNTSNLVNSAYRILYQMPGGFVGKAGYSANYAEYVNNASGKLKGKQRPKDKGKSQGVYWGPSGEPDFLRKGFERDGIDEIKDVIKRGYTI